MKKVTSVCSSKILIKKKYFISAYPKLRTYTWGKKLIFSLPLKPLHCHLQINTSAQQVPRRYKKACGTQCSEEILTDTVLVFKNTSKKTFTRCQWLGKQNPFSQSIVFPFLEPETKCEVLQGSLLNFVGLEGFTLQVLGWSI